MEKMLAGKVALVTGGGRGIGKAIAKKLAENGATTLIIYNGSAQKAQDTVDELKAEGVESEAFQCNVAEDAACEAVVKDILAKYQKVDILVNNAGITKDNLIMRMSEADFDAVVDTNLKGSFLMTKHLSRNFLKLRGGRIINIASVSGVIGNAGQANYSASKAGLIGLTKSVARELATRNVCVNAVAPGFIETEMTEAMAEGALDAAKQAIPMGRIGQTQDIAEMVAFLASDKAGYITGQVICVDGGMSM